MQQVLTEPLFYVDLFYGLSFLLMSFVVFEGASKASPAKFVTTFYMLGGFGLFHGITELIDWTRYALKAGGAGEFEVLIILSQSCLITSYVLLFQFGVNLLTYDSENKGIYRLLPALLFVVYIAYIFVSETSRIRTAGLIARRGFGFSGAVVSGIAFFRLAGSIKGTGHPRLMKGLIATGTGFLFYAVFGGLMVEPILGVPIQIFRAVCALTIAIYSFSILEILKVTK